MYHDSPDVSIVGIMNDSESDRVQDDLSETRDPQPRSPPVSYS